MPTISDHLDDYREILQRFRQMQLGEHGGTLYIIRAGDTDFYKIGRTRGGVGARCDQLQVGNHRALTIVAKFRTKHIKQLEKAVHAALDRLRGIGEWFELSRGALRDAQDKLLPRLLEEKTC